MISPAPQGASEGIAQGINSLAGEVNQDTQARRAGLLQMQMQSAGIEKQMQARMAEQQQESNLQISQSQAQYQRQTIPQNEFDTINNQLGQFHNAIISGQDIPHVDFTNIHSVAGQQAALKGFQELFSADASRMRALRPFSQTINDPNNPGHKLFRMYNPATGTADQWADVGISQYAANDISKASTAMLGEYSTLKRLYDQGQRFLNSDSVTSRAAQFASMKMNEWTQSDPEAAAFFKQITPLTMVAEKAKTGANPRAVSVIEGWRSSMPDMGDTGATFRNKLNNMLDMYREALEGTYDAYGLQPQGRVKQVLEEIRANKGFGAGPGSGYNFSAEDARRAALKQAAQPQK